MSERAVLSFIALLLAPAVAPAQSRMAQLTGIVQDSSGSIAPGARVAARNVATGIEKTVVRRENYFLVRCRSCPASRRR